ncbi:MAG: endonuclease/exonuclease/phosphatase family protein [Woeseiaceae bacterium]
MFEQTLRILSYNLQVGIQTTRKAHYITGGWKHLLPHPQRFKNLDKLTPLLRGYDIVGLQETDAGSLRSNHINLTEYLATHAGFTHWHHQVNRNFANIAKHSNGLLSKVKPYAVEDIRLPGLVPGRQAMLAKYKYGEETFAVIILHLALSKGARMKQLIAVSKIVNEFSHAVVMGDFNCKTESNEMKYLFNNTHLREPIENCNTFPSWRPQHHIDHVLVTSKIDVVKIEAVQHVCSDHLPLMIEIKLPEKLDKNKPAVLQEEVEDA